MVDFGANLEEANNGAKIIAEALNNNEVVTKVNLSNNGFDEKTGYEIRKIFEGKKTVQLFISVQELQPQAKNDDQNNNTKKAKFQETIVITNSMHSKCFVKEVNGELQVGGYNTYIKKEEFFVLNDKVKKIIIKNIKFSDVNSEAKMALFLIRNPNIHYDINASESHLLKNVINFLSGKQSFITIDHENKDVVIPIILELKKVKKDIKIHFYEDLNSDWHNKDFSKNMHQFLAENPDITVINRGFTNNSEKEENKIDEVKEFQKKCEEFTSQLETNPNKQFKVTQDLKYYALNQFADPLAQNIIDISFKDCLLDIDDIQMICDLITPKEDLKLSEMQKKIDEEQTANLTKLSKLKYLDLSNSNLGYEEIKLLTSALKQNKTITHLNLSGNTVDEQVAKDLVSLLENNNTITHLDLGNCYLTKNSIEMILKALEKNKSLTSISFAGNNFGDDVAIKIMQTLESRANLTNVNFDGCLGEKGIKAFAEFVSKKNTITEINLGHCNLGRGARIKALEVGSKEYKEKNVPKQELLDLHNALTKSKNRITYLDLSGNNLHDNDIDIIIEILRKNPHITHLNLSDNNISAEGVRKLAGFLEFNTNIVNIDLSYNIIKEGAFIILDLLQKNNNIQQINLYGSLNGYKHTEEVLEKLTKHPKIHTNDLRMLKEDLSKYGVIKEMAELQEQIFKYRYAKSQGQLSSIGKLTLMSQPNIQKELQELEDWADKTKRLNYDKNAAIFETALGSGKEAPRFKFFRFKETGYFNENETHKSEPFNNEIDSLKEFILFLNEDKDYVVGSFTIGAIYQLIVDSGKNLNDVLELKKQGLALKIVDPLLEKFAEKSKKHDFILNILQDTINEAIHSNKKEIKVRDPIDLPQAIKTLEEIKLSGKGDASTNALLENFRSFAKKKDIKYESLEPNQPQSSSSSAAVISVNNQETTSNSNQKPQASVATSANSSSNQGLRVQQPASSSSTSSNISGQPTSQNNNQASTSKPKAGGFFSTLNPSKVSTNQVSKSTESSSKSIFSLSKPDKKDNKQTGPNNSQDSSSKAVAQNNNNNNSTNQGIELGIDAFHIIEKDDPIIQKKDPKIHPGLSPKQAAIQNQNKVENPIDLKTDKKTGLFTKESLKELSERRTKNPNDPAVTQALEQVYSFPAGNNGGRDNLLGTVNALSSALHGENKDIDQQKLGLFSKIKETAHDMKANIDKKRLGGISTDPKRLGQMIEDLGKIINKFPYERLEVEAMALRREMLNVLNNVDSKLAVEIENKIRNNSPTTSVNVEKTTHKAPEQKK